MKEMKETKSLKSLKVQVKIGFFRTQVNIDDGLLFRNELISIIR